MQFSSGITPFAIGVYESMELVGQGAVSRFPQVIPSTFPFYGGVFQMLGSDMKSAELDVELDVQFRSDDRQQAQYIAVHLVRLPAVPVSDTPSILAVTALPSIAEMSFNFGPELKTYESGDYKNVFCVRKTLPIVRPAATDDTFLLHKGDRLALMLDARQR